MIRHCAFCGQLFLPRPQVPNQAYCSATRCQRARRLRWQREKLRDDPDYRENQRAAQRAWHKRHLDYWRNYRATHPEYAERNRDRQRSKRQPTKPLAVATMVSSAPGPGIYRLRIVTVEGLVRRGAWIVELVPVCVDDSRKKDVCK